MRVSSAVGLSLLFVAADPGAAAAQARRRATSPPSQIQGPSLLSEFRFGFSAQDPWGPERGSGALAGEVLLAKPFTAADLFTSYFIPRPHFGGSLNLGGRQSYAYAGVTWSVDVMPRVFVEGSLGGAVHDGKSHALVPSPTRPAIGCSPVFREAGSVGVRLSGQWSLVATVEHLSDTRSCAQDRGLTNVGARFGYAF